MGGPFLWRSEYRARFVQGPVGLLQTAGDTAALLIATRPHFTNAHIPIRPA
jgi:hypothetical protein